MPKKKDDGSTTFVSAGNRVISSAMSQANRRAGKAKKGGASGGTDADAGGYYEKPPKVALSYDDYRKGHQEGETDLDKIEAIAKELSAEYPLLDQPLILSIILDYATPDNIYANYDEIKDNLAVFEASLVVDEEETFSMPDTYGKPEGGGSHAGIESISGSGSGSGSGSNGQAREEAELEEGSRSGSGIQSLSGDAGSGPGDTGDNELDNLPPRPIDPAVKLSTRNSSTRRAKRPHSGTHTPRHLDQGDDDVDNDVGDFAVLPDRMEKLHFVEARDYGFPPAGHNEPRDELPGSTRAIKPAKGSPITTSSAVSSILDGSADGDEAGSEGDLDPTIFLTEMFPTLQQLIITHTLNECEYDLSAAIESLLSVERIRDVQERGDWKDDGDTDTDEERPQPRPANGRKLWQESVPEPVSATDSEPDELVRDEPPSGQAVSRKRKADRVTSALELGVVPKPLALTLPLYGKIHGHSKSSARKTDETKVPRVREISGQSDRPTYSSRAGMFAVFADHADSHRGIDSDNESVASSNGHASSSRTSLDGARPSPMESFPPIKQSTAATAKNTPLGPKFNLDQAEVSKVHSMASWLASLIGRPKATEQYFADHMLEAKNGTPGSGLERALQGLHNGRDELGQQIQQMSLLVDGDILTEDSELCVRASGGDISAALDLLNALQQVRSWPPLWVPDLSDNAGSDLPRLGPSRRLFPPSPQRAALPKKAQHPQNWKTVSKAAKAKSGPQHPLADFIPAYARGATPQDDTPGSLYGRTQSYDLKSCNHFAAEQRQRRAEAMRLAGHYFKSGMKGVAAGRGKEVASYYAAEARRLEADAMRWELQAARQIVERNSMGQDRWVIDIHHLTLVEASAVVREQVQAWHEAFGLAPLPSKPFRIITGVGKHSASHIAVLRPAIANLLDKDGWKVDKSQKAEGYIIVRGIRGA